MSNNRELSPKRPSAFKKAIHHLKGMLLSPYGIAAISSLSFHAVLFAALPRFTSASFAAFSEEEAGGEARTVPLVTLSAAEQGRLPNFNQPQLTDIPDITASTPLNRLPNPTLLDRANTGRSSLLDRNRINRNRSNYNRRFTTDFRINNTPTRSNQAKPENSEAVVSIPPPPPADNFRETVTDEEILRKQQELEEQQAAAEANEDSQEGPGLPPLPDEEPEASTESDDGQEIAAAPEIPLSQLEQLQASAGLSYDDSQTDENAVEESYARWESETEIEGDVAIKTAEETDSVIVGEGLNLLCRQPEPQPGEIGVLVGPDGTPLDASVLLSTGYNSLNQAALEHGFDERTYPETEQATRYRIAVTIDYDHEATCTSAQELLESAREPSPDEEEQVEE